MSVLDKNHIYRASPYRWYAALSELTEVHQLFGKGLRSLIDIVMEYFWDEPPVFVKLPKNVDIASAVRNGNILDAVDDLPIPSETYGTAASIGRIGTSYFDDCGEFGDPFIVVFVSPYSFPPKTPSGYANETHNHVFGVIYPSIHTDTSKSWKESPISFSAWRPGVVSKDDSDSPWIRIKTKRIDDRYHSWNDYGHWDTFGYEFASTFDPLTWDDYYPVHLIAPDLKSLPVKDPRRDCHSTSTVYYTYEFVDEPIFLYKQDQQIDPSRMLIISNSENFYGIDPGSMCPSNILTAFEYQNIVSYSTSTHC